MNYKNDAEGVPNLDAMEGEALWDFYLDYRRGSDREKKSLLFPTHPPGWLKACHLLADYAANKAQAITLRKQGAIVKAMAYEDVCEALYAELPEFARW